MGNAVSKVADIGLKAVCVATNGLIGKSDEGYNVGPLRFRKDSIGIKLNLGIVSFGVHLGKNEFGRIGVDASVSLGLPGVGSGTVRLGTDTDGTYWGGSMTYGEGPFKASKSFVVNEKGCSFNAGVDGPLMTHLNYSNNTGMSMGALGVSVNEEGETDFKGVENIVAKTLGENMKQTFDSRFGNKQKQEKDSSNSKDEKQKNKSKTDDSDKYHSSSTHKRSTKQSDFKKYKQGQTSLANKESKTEGTKRTQENIHSNPKAEKQEENPKIYEGDLYQSSEKFKQDETSRADNEKSETEGNTRTREKIPSNSKTEKQEENPKIYEGDRYQSSDGQKRVTKQSDFKKFKQGDTSRADNEKSETEGNTRTREKIPSNSKTEKQEEKPKIYEGDRYQSFDAYKRETKKVDQSKTSDFDEYKVKQRGPGNLVEAKQYDFCATCRGPCKYEKQ